MIVKYDEDNFSIKLYRDFVKGKLVGLMEVIPIDELLDVWEKYKAEQTENSSEKPNNCDTCRWGEWYKQGYDVTMMSDECGGCCSWNNKWTPLYKCLDIKKIIKSLPTRKFEDEPQTDCPWK